MSTIDRRPMSVMKRCMRPRARGFHTDRPTVDVIGWYCVEQDAEDGAVLLIDTADLGEHFGAAEIAGLGRVEVGYFQRDAHSGREDSTNASMSST